MRNFVQPGDSLTVVAAANATSGAVVVMGQMFGIATHNALTGENLTLKLGGVFDLTKANAASMSMAVGENVYWHAAGSQATTSASSNTRLGVAVVAANNTVTTVRVRLNDTF